jgi:caffeoyl-CoA O-methyltransferase
VLDAATQHASVQAVRETNDVVASDDRVEAVMLPMRDGVTIARKR